MPRKKVRELMQKIIRKGIRKIRGEKENRELMRKRKRNDISCKWKRRYNIRRQKRRKAARRRRPARRERVSITRDRAWLRLLIWQGKRSSTRLGERTKHHSLL